MLSGNVFSKDEGLGLDEDRVCRTDGARLGNSEGGGGVAGAQRKGGRKRLEGFYQWGSNDCIFMTER